MSAVFGKPNGKVYSQLAFNAVSVLARLFAGVVLFVFMAREMGPSSFGQFMYAMSLAALLAFPAALGFGQQVLREVAAYPARADRIIAAVSGAKLMLTVAVLALVGGLGLVVGGEWPLIAVLTSVALADSLTEYLFCVLRARGLYAAEAGFMTIVSAVHFVAVMWGLSISVSPIHVGVFFCMSKSLQTLAAWVLFRKLLPTVTMRSNWSQQWAEIRSGISYAGDVAVSTLSSQMDTIIVRHSLGVHAAGLYQSGMRLLVGLQNFSSVAGNVFIPRLASVHAEPVQFAKVARQASWVFGALGIALAAVLGVGGWMLVEHGYGQAYAPVMHLLPWMAVLIAMRLFAAGLGVQLTALGDQKFRTLVNLMCLVLMTAGLWIGSVSYGLEGAVASLMFIILVISACYYWRIKKLR